MKFWTQVITAPLVITHDDGAFFVSVLARGGEVDILGTAIFQGLPSAIATLQDTETWTYSAQFAEGPIHVTITPNGGAAVLMVGFSGS